MMTKRTNIHGPLILPQISWQHTNVEAVEPSCGNNNYSGFKNSDALDTRHCPVDGSGQPLAWLPSRDWFLYFEGQQLESFWLKVGFPFGLGLGLLVLTTLKATDQGF